MSVKTEETLAGLTLEVEKAIRPLGFRIRDVSDTRRDEQPPLAMAGGGFVKMDSGELKMTIVHEGINKSLKWVDLSETPMIIPRKPNDNFTAGHFSECPVFTVKKLDCIITNWEKRMEGVSNEKLIHEAAAVKLLGITLEKIEKNMLREMGGRVGRLTPMAEIVKPSRQPNDFLMSARVALVFDIKKLNEYFTSNKELESEATIIKLLGMTLEKVEKEMLWEMGGQVGGPGIDITRQPGGMTGIKFIMDFDLEKLNEYHHANGSVGSI